MSARPQLADQRRNGTAPTPSPGRARAVLANLDILLAALGIIGVTIAITVLAGWPWGLLAASIALIISALVVPTWD
jgi:fatty acid desaturase